MITRYTKYHIYGDTPSELYGLSSDTKPVDVGNASIFYEMDTKKIFMFDKENNTWHEQ